MSDQNPAERPPLKLLEHKPKEPEVAWTAEEMVGEFLSDILEGKVKPVKCMILYFEETPSGGLLPHRWFAGGMKHAEEIALLEVAKLHAIEDWRE